jgi:hypothetical protein
MSSERSIIKLEKEIKMKMISIRSKSVTPKDSGIGKYFTILKGVDEVLYEKMLNEYKSILNEISKG